MLLLGRDSRIARGLRRLKIKGHEQHHRVKCTSLITLLELAESMLLLEANFVNEVHTAICLHLHFWAIAVTAPIS